MQASTIGPAEPAQQIVVEAGELGRNLSGRGHVCQKEAPTLLRCERVIKQLECLLIVPCNGQRIRLEYHRLNGVRLQTQRLIGVVGTEPRPGEHLVEAIGQPHPVANATRIRGDRRPAVGHHLPYRTHPVR